jgi:hypothetical protein
MSLGPTTVTQRNVLSGFRPLVALDKYLSISSITYVWSS